MIKCHGMLLSQFDETVRNTWGRPRVTTLDVEHAFDVVDQSKRWNVAGFYRPPDRFLYQLNCTADLAQVPICLSEVGCRCCASIRAKAKSGVMIALRIVNSQRFTEMHSRITESAFIEASHAQVAIRDRRFRHTTRAFG